jgi:hypothetical protein
MAALSDALLESVISIIPTLSAVIARNDRDFRADAFFGKLLQITFVVEGLYRKATLRGAS